MTTSLLSNLTTKFHSTHPLLVALLTLVLVTTASYLLPEKYGATGVGLVFLAMTYFVALSSDQQASTSALQLAGLLEDGPVSVRRLGRATLNVLVLSTATMCLVVPTTWIGFVAFNLPPHTFDIHAGLRLSDAGLPTGAFFDLVLGHLFVVALPEEAFFRGYLQSRLDRLWPAGVRLFGTKVGVSLVVTSAIFALGHLATEPNVSRLAVFFPSLLFGWLRQRTGGIGAAVVVHTSCNVLMMVLSAGYAAR